MVSLKIVYLPIDIACQWSSLQNSEEEEEADEEEDLFVFNGIRAKIGQYGTRHIYIYTSPSRSHSVPDLAALASALGSALDANACIHIYVHAHKCLYIYIYAHTHVCAHIYGIQYAHTHVCVHTYNMYTHTFVCAHTLRGGCRG